MDLAALVGAWVEQARPENVDQTAITVTNEGPTVQIVTLPHRDLGGVSLVVWGDPRRAGLLWANVRDLSTHDDLDLGVVVGRFSYDGDWRARLAVAIAEESRRPVQVVLRRSWLGTRRVECRIVVDGRSRRIGVLHPPGDRSAGDAGMTTALAGGARPWFSLSPAIGSGR